MVRYSKPDWLELGMRLLREDGPGTLTIDGLTEAAGRTRGSFYHHFASRDGFLSDLMAHWRAQAIEAKAQLLQADPSPQGLLAFLREEPLRMDFRFERAVRQLAATEPIVRRALGQMDRTRIETLASLISALRPEIGDARSAAFIQYAVVVGSHWLLDDPDDPRIPAVQDAAYRLFQLLEV